MSEPDKQIEYLQGIERSIDAAQARRRAWIDLQSRVLDHLGAIGARVEKAVPTFRLAAIPVVDGNERSIILKFGNNPTGLTLGPNALMVERGAQMNLGLEINGLVTAIYYPAAIDDERQSAGVTLATLEPLEVMLRLDSIVADFFHRVSEDHWSRVTPQV